MAAARKKPFRIERVGPISTPADNAADPGSAKHRELMQAITEVQERLAPQQEVSTDLLERYRAELDEAQKIKSELDEIYQAIAETKRDIATLHHRGFGEEQISTASSQLDAVVAHTESAAEVILAAAEQIDIDATNLAAALTGPENEMAADIQEQVIKIFESCNFQDITGQRITKVINTLKFIEERVSNMMEIWGGIDGFSEPALEMERPQGDAAQLNGPALPEAENTASQDDIDALFD